MHISCVAWYQKSDVVDLIALVVVVFSRFEKWEVDCLYTATQEAWAKGGRVSREAHRHRHRHTHTHTHTHTHFNLKKKNTLSSQQLLMRWTSAAVKLGHMSSRLFEKNLNKNYINNNTQKRNIQAALIQMLGCHDFQKCSRQVYEIKFSLSLSLSLSPSLSFLWHPAIVMCCCCCLFVFYVFIVQQ